VVESWSLIVHIPNCDNARSDPIGLSNMVPVFLLVESWSLVIHISDCDNARSNPIGWSNMVPVFLLVESWSLIVHIPDGDGHFSSAAGHVVFSYKKETQFKGTLAQDLHSGVWDPHLFYCVSGTVITKVSFRLLKNQNYIFEVNYVPPVFILSITFMYLCSLMGLLNLGANWDLHYLTQPNVDKVPAKKH
jgi:hypothetical protein